MPPGTVGSSIDPTDREEGAMTASTVTAPAESLRGLLDGAVYLPGDPG